MQTVDTIDTIAREVAFEKGESLERLELYIHYGKEAYRDFKFDMAKEIKTVRLEMTPWKSLKLPDDCLDLVKVGVVVRGQILTFTHDQYLPMDRQKCDKSIDTVLPSGRQGSFLPITGPTAFFASGSYVYYSNYYNEYGEFKGRLYGLAGNDNGLGYYRWDREKKEVHLNVNSSLETAQFIVEYIGNCDNPTEATVVNPLAKKMIKFYIDWRLAERDPNVPGNRAARLEDVYWNEFRRVVSRMSDVDIGDIIEASRQYYMMTPRA